jgi:hypothetical protein
MTKSSAEDKNVLRYTSTPPDTFTEWSLVKQRDAFSVGHAVVQLVKAMRYKQEGRGFDSRWCH